VTNETRELCSGKELQLVLRGMDSSNQQALESLAVDSATARTPRGSRASGGGPSVVRRKVFFLLDSLNVGGTETQAVELAIRLNSERYEVTLGCLRARGPLRERLAAAAVSVCEFYPKGGSDSIQGIYQMFRLAIFLRRGGFRIVHTHDLYANLLGIPAAMIARVPVIISSQRDLSHLGLYQTRRRVWLRHLQRLSTAVLTNAGAVRDALLAENHFAREKVRVIHNGVDMQKFAHGSRDREWLKQDTAQEKWIGLVGNMHSDVKGHPWLIAAAELITREFPATRFVLVGDGELRKDYERQVAELGLGRHFLFLGHRDDVPRVLACCDIAILPSKAEGLPNAVLEYLAVGLPTVATRVGGNTEIIQDGKTGLLIPPEDSAALAEGILRLLREPGFAASLGKNGREYVASEFSFKKMIENTDQLYTELLHSRGAE
jgi:glycosyltransferase involved in cell wall biosynthesis